METDNNGITLLHPHFTVHLVNGARLVRGRIGKAISFNGSRQYLDLGVHDDKCFANIEQCRNGLTISLWLKARELEENTYFLSSPSYSLSYRNGKLWGRFHQNGRMWEVSSPNFRSKRWYKIDLSWSPQGGLSMFQDGNLIGKSDSWTTVARDERVTKNVYVGRAQSEDSRSRYANAIVDELQYWYGPRTQVETSGQAFAGMLYVYIYYYHVSFVIIMSSMCMIQKHFKYFVDGKVFKI